MKMNPDLKIKWVEALRSGKYQQAQGGLRRTDGFCCLGVLCDIVDPSGWNTTPHKLENGKKYYYYLKRDCYLPKTVMSEINMDPRDEIDLSVMNDEGKSFLEIAEHIEKKLC